MFVHNVLLKLDITWDDKKNSFVNFTVMRQNYKLNYNKHKVLVLQYILMTSFEFPVFGFFFV
jgi:hypothetical protein